MWMALGDRSVICLNRIARRGGGGGVERGKMDRQMNKQMSR